MSTLTYIYSWIFFNCRQSRLVAYRQFICWMLRGEKLGKGRRVVIPSCVVKTIRKAFPDPNHDYTGFKLALDSAHELFHYIFCI